jgi:hypothetical protein
LMYRTDRLHERHEDDGQRAAACRHLGKFRIASFYVEKEPKLVAAALRDLVIVRCEHMWQEPSFEYIAFSEDKFDLIPLGGETPWYDVTIISERGKYVVEFTRMEKPYPIGALAYQQDGGPLHLGWR